MLSGSYGVKDIDPLKYAITNPGVQRLARPIAGHDCETYETPVEASARRSIEAAGGRLRERSEPSRHIAKENQRRAPDSNASVRCIQIGNLAPSRRIDVGIHGKDRLGKPFKTIGASLWLQSVSESGSAPPPITLTAELGSQQIRLRSAYGA
jgi:hypothetical protein